MPRSFPAAGWPVRGELPLAEFCSDVLPGLPNNNGFATVICFFITEALREFCNESSRTVDDDCFPLTIRDFVADRERMCDAGMVAEITERIDLLK